VRTIKIKRVAAALAAAITLLCLSAVPATAAPAEQ
jgi:hypothetical protein